MTRARDLADSADKDIAGTVTLDDIILSNDITLADNGKAIFGAGSDLQIYHDGSESIIKDAGTGNLKILATDLRINNADSSKSYITGVDGGYVNLYYNGSQKLVTTSTGIDVTGGVSIDDDNNFSFGDGTTYIQGSGAADRIKFITAGSEAMRIDSNGNVGIGTTPSTPSGSCITIYNSTLPRINFKNSTTGTASTDGAEFYLSGNQFYMNNREATGTIHFSTQTTERMRIDSSGNVGIGNTNPSYALEVGDALGIYDDNTSAVVAANTGHDLELRSRSSQNVRIVSGGSEAMRIDSSGNVGIGTSSIAAKLHIESASGSITPSVHADELLVEGSGNSGITIGSGISSQGSIRFADSGGDSRGQVNYDHSADSLRFYTADSLAATIDSSGNVGIGVVPKTTNATVTGSLNINRTGIIVRNNEQVYWTSNIYWDASDQMKSLGSGYGVATAFIPSDGSQRFYTTTASAGSADANLTLDETMRITSGNLFVGKTSANLALTGIQATSSGQAFSVTRDGGAPFNLNRLTSDGELAGFWKDTVKVGSIGTDNAGDLFIGTGDTGLLFVDSADAIMPWNTSPAARTEFISLGDASNRFKNLYLSSSIILQRAESASVGTFGRNTDGTARTLFTFRSESQNATVGTITVTNSTTAYNTSSDYRLKTDAQPMTGATDRLKQLNPVNFEWIADGTRVDGFLAHEAQAVVPEAVTGAKDAMRDEEYEVTPAVLDDDGNVVTEAVMGTRSVPDYQGIDQSKLVPLLVATIKELEARITALENA